MECSKVFTGQIATLIEGNNTVMRGVVLDNVTVSGKWEGDTSVSLYVVDGVRWENVPVNESPELRNFSVRHSCTDVGGHDLHIDGEKICHLRTGSDGRFALKFIDDTRLVR